jgi:hypothetical protein
MTTVAPYYKKCSSKNVHDLFMFEIRLRLGINQKSYCCKRTNSCSTSPYRGVLHEIYVHNESEYVAALARLVLPNKKMNFQILQIPIKPFYTWFYLFNYSFGITGYSHTGWSIRCMVLLL